MSSIDTSTQALRVSLWSDRRLAYGLLPVVTLLESQGLDAGPALEGSGIDRFGLTDPAYTISIEQELDVLRQLLRALPGPGLSLTLGRRYRLRSFSVLGLAMQASASPLDMLRLMSRYPRLAWGVFDGHLQIEDQQVRIDFASQPALGPLQGFLAERDLACALTLVEEALGGTMPVTRLSFRHACTGDPARYADFFGCPVDFQAPYTRMVLPRAAMLQALPQADPTICYFYSAQCERMSRDMDQPFRYAEAVLRRLRGSEPMADLKTLAGQMHMTPRTLQRRLGREGRRYSELLREAREQRARQLLTDTDMPMERIAARLGFQDAVAFSHAFKSWLGESPRAWRQRVSPALSDRPGLGSQ